MNSFAVKLIVFSFVAIPFVAPANATSIVLTADLSGPSANQPGAWPNWSSANSFAGANRASNSYGSADGQNGQSPFPQWDWPESSNAPIMMPPGFSAFPSDNTASATERRKGQRHRGQRGDDSSGDSADSSDWTEVSSLNPVMLSDQTQALFAGPDRIITDPETQPVFAAAVLAETAAVIPFAAAVDPAAIPEPSSYFLFGTGLGIFVGFKVKRRRKTARAASRRRHP
jgi:hypothetical protein